MLTLADIVVFMLVYVAGEEERFGFGVGWEREGAVERTSMLMNDVDSNDQLPINSGWNVLSFRKG